MQFIRGSIFAKFLIGIIVSVFCLEGSSAAFAANNLRKRAAAEDGLPKIENALIEANNLDGGSENSDTVVTFEKKDGGSVSAFVGGTGDMGKALADRLIRAGKEVYKGSRKPNPAANIYANKDAVQKADKVFFTVSGKEKVKEIKKPDGTTEKIVTSPLRDSVMELAPYLKKDAIVISVATVFERVGKKLTYLPPAKTWDKEGNVLERYNSAAEATEDWLRSSGAFNEVQSWGVPNLPAEQMSNPSIRLKIQVAVAGNEKSCSLPGIKDFFNDLNLEVEPVYVGGLKECCWIESLTPKIIIGRKEYIVALEAGLVTVEEAIGYMRSNGENCDSKGFIEFIRSRLDPYLTKKYGSDDVFKSDIAFINDRKKPLEERELTFVGLLRYSEIVTEKEKSMKLMLDKAVKSFAVETAETKFIDALPGNFGKVMETAKKVATGPAAMVFRADDILKNAGNVLLLRAIKEAGLPVRVTVLADKDSEIDTLKLIGVDEVVADIRKAPPGEILRELLDDKIPVERIVAVGFIGIELPDFAKGVTVLYLKAPQLAKEGDSYINAMPLVIARALAAIFKDKELIKVYEELSKSYFEKDKINEYQLSQIDNSVDKVIDVPLDNVVNIVIDVPLIKVGIDEEATKGQIAYEAVVASI